MMIRSTNKPAIIEELAKRWYYRQQAYKKRLEYMSDEELQKELDQPTNNTERKETNVRTNR